jgi:hypothetical protein
VQLGFPEGLNVSEAFGCTYLRGVLLACNHFKFIGLDASLCHAFGGMLDWSRWSGGCLHGQVVAWLIKVGKTGLCYVLLHNTAKSS